MQASDGHGANPLPRGVVLLGDDMISIGIGIGCSLEVY
jgi:hypothetical protein